MRFETQKRPFLISLPLGGDCQIRLDILFRLTYTYSMKTESVDTFFDTIKPSIVKRYNKHWEAIKPVTVDDIFRRYLFAFTSVHSTWQSNIRGYLALKDLSWVNNKNLLLSRLVWARCGVHNMRTKTIWAFKEQFYANPDRFCNVDGDWRTYRNELVKEINGLGVTKVSFALEMCFPKEALVSCIDVHGLRLYGLDVNVLISALYGVMAPVCIVLMLLAMFFAWVSRKFEAGEELVDDWAQDLDEHADYD